MSKRWVNCNFSVTFIKSLNQSSIKPCLIVHLVALWTLKQISFPLPPKIPPGRRAKNFLPRRISNVRLSSGPNGGQEITHQSFKGDTTNQRLCSIYLSNCNFSFTFPSSGLGLSAILRSLDYNQYLKVLFSYLDPVLINKERSRFVRCWHAKTDGGQHQHSTVTAMGGDPQWLSSKLTVISLVDTLTCPGPAVSKKQANISHM